jgi:hypothetical protein
LPSAPTGATPLLQGLARRIQQRQPKALQLRLAAQDIREHPAFFASSAALR